jgi:apolipoprotein N-acyltransferase
MMMNIHARPHQVGPPDRLGYLWLALGILFSLFAAHGRWDLSLAAWLVPLFVLRFTRSQSLRTSFCGALLASAVAMLSFLYQSHLLNPLSIVIFLLMSSILALPYLLDRLIAPRLALLSGVLATLIFPLSRVVVEYLLSFLPFGSFFSLATTQYGNLPLLQVISVTGVYGVSFLMAWSASVGNGVWEQHFSWPRIRTSTLLFSGLLALVLLGGSLRLAFFPPSGQTVRVASISASASARHLFPSPKQIRLLAQSHPAQLRADFITYNNALLDRSRSEARAGAKIIVWTEVGAVTLAEDKTRLIERVQALAREEHVYLDMGLAMFQLPATYLNQAILIDPEGHVVWTYNKHYPAPGDPQGPGEGKVPTTETPYGRLANVICFDADFPFLMRQAGSQDVSMMLVPSSDAQGIALVHTQLLTFQAIENGYSLVKPTNLGLSMAVDYQGRVLAATDYFTTDQPTMIANVPMKGAWTIYAHVGDLFAFLCLIGWLGLAGFVALTSMYRRVHPSVLTCDPSLVSTEEKHEVGTGRR